MINQQNSIVNWWKDWQQETGLLGKVELIEYVGDTLPFCLADSVHGLSNNVYYHGEKWKARILNHPTSELVLITTKVFHGIGLPKEDNSNMKDSSSLLIDNFDILPTNTYEWTVRVDDSETNGHIF